MASNKMKERINESGLFNNPISWTIIFLFILSINIHDFIKRDYLGVLGFISGFRTEVGDLFLITLNFLAIVFFGIYILYFFKKIFKSELKNNWTIRESNESAALFVKFVAILIFLIVLQSITNIFGSQYLRYGEKLSWSSPNFLIIGLISLIDSFLRIYQFIISLKIIKFLFIAINALVSERSLRKPSSFTEEEQEIPENERELFDEKKIYSNRSILLLNESISNNKKTEILFLILIFLVLTTGIFSFFKFLGRSILSEVQESAQLVNANEIKSIINQRSTAVRLRKINTYTKAAIIDIEKVQGDRESEFKNSVLTLLRQIYSDSRTLTSETDETTFSNLLDDLDQTATKLVQSISKLPPVDWERIFIRIAILTLALFIIQMLFVAYKYIRSERTKIQNQLMAILLSSYLDDKEKINNFSQVIDDLSKQSVSFGKVPDTIINTLIKSASDATKSIKKE